jgi:LAGLIDADG-like domain
MSMRAKLNTHNLTRLFDTLSGINVGVKQIAGLLEISERSVRDWRRGKYTMPSGDLSTLAFLAQISIDDMTIEYVDDTWHSVAAGKIGGRSYIDTYGTPGTAESRKKGGTTTYLKSLSKNESIYVRKKIIRADESVELAEFIGIMIGDGNVNNYQASISLNRESDKEYADYVTDLASGLFGVGVTRQDRVASGCYVLVMSSVELTDYLVSMGLPRGDKIAGGLTIPQWILDDERYLVACIRGIFDTDGSVYQETHHYNQKQYSYCRVALVSHSPPLRDIVNASLSRLGIASKIRNNRSVCIERFTDVTQYFKIVGSSNQKHLNRFAVFGRVG